ncbi:MAG: Uma2 family endonuclease [Luteitalea sp.]|nr:Uma2 family endonuclease [Luteitalea sp.]
MTMPQTASYVDAIGHVPPGGTLIVTNVPWSEYEQLLSTLGEGYTARITYDRGRLEIMAPSSSHEMYKELLVGIGRLVAQEMGVDLESRGSTTFKVERFAQGAEPDTCFYVQHATSIIGKTMIDLETDPPPDVIVEVDVSHASINKLDFYASLGVPEVWRYDERRMCIYHLTAQGYVEALASRTFPPLTGNALTEFLERSKSAGQSAALRSVRDWLRQAMAQGSTQTDDR